MVYALAAVIGFIGGVLGGLVNSAFKRDELESAPSAPNPNVVEKRGPSLYTTVKKKTPKAQSEKELWEKENKQNIND